MIFVRMAIGMFLFKQNFFFVSPMPAIDAVIRKCVNQYHRKMLTFEICVTKKTNPPTGVDEEPIGLLILSF